MTPAKTIQGILCLDWIPHKRNGHTLTRDIALRIKKREKVTKRTLNIYTKLSYDEIGNTLNLLINNDIIESVTNKKSTFFRLKKEQKEED